MAADDKVRKVIFCSGQVYYDLDAERTKKGHDDVAICRIEQISPFPFRDVEKVFKQYPNATLTWAQEEPKNAGCWDFVYQRF